MAPAKHTDHANDERRLNVTRWPTVQAVVFDFDGTLTLPGAIDFEAMRLGVGCPDGEKILEHIENLATAAERAAGWAWVERLEAEAAMRARPHEGAEECLRELRALGLPVAVVTRNTRAAVEMSLRQFRETTPRSFDLVVAREDVAQQKPHPEGLLRVAAHLGVPPTAMVMVGDYTHDIEAGQRAGCRTVLLMDAACPATWPVQPDYQIQRLAELVQLVRRWR